MDQYQQPVDVTETRERVGLGVLGAFLFALAGGIAYYVFWSIGIIAGLSGLIGVFCAIKGYEIFAKKSTKRGIVIAVIMAAIVLIVAWYFCFCTDMLAAYEMWYEEGEVDYVPTLGEYLPYGFWDLTVNPAYFVDLLISLALGALGCFGYVSQSIKRQQAVAARQAAQAETMELSRAQAEQAAKAEEQVAEPAADAQALPDAWEELNAKVEPSNEDTEA